MGLMSRETFIKENCNELLVLLKQLYTVCLYNNKTTIEDLLKVALLGSSMEDLKKNPEEVMGVLLPMIMSIAEKDKVFKEAVDILFTDGIVDCIQRVKELKR